MSYELQDRSPRIVITLVHGTFAPDADWMKPGSPLHTELEKRLRGRAAFQVFNWSGKNTHRARLAAGEELSRQLAAQIARNPGAQHCIVAHSHGGNIALYALRNEEIGPRVRGVVALATPFICAHPRDFVAAIGTLLKTSALALMVIPFLTMFLGFYLLPRNERLAPGLIWGSFALLFLMGILSSFGGARIGRAIFGVADSVLARLSHSQRKVVETLGVPSARSYSLFCAAVRGDEARGGLGLIDRLSDVPFALFDRMGQVVSATSDFTEEAVDFANKANTVIRPLRALAGDTSGMVGALGIVVTMMLSLILLPATLAVLAVAAALLFCANAPVVRRIGYWGEEFRAGLMAQLFVRPSPHGSPEATLLKLYDVSPTARKRSVWNVPRRLAHCNVYEDPAVIADIATWIESGCPRPAAQALERHRRPVRKFGAADFGETVVAVTVAVAIALGLAAYLAM